MDYVRDEYKKLKKAVGFSLFFDRDKGHLKKGHIILAIKRTRSLREYYVVGEVREVTGAHVVFRWCREYCPRTDSTWGLFDRYEPMENIMAFYRVKKPGLVRGVWERSDCDPARRKAKTGEFFEIIRGGLEETLESRFLQMDQALPVELGRMGPEEKLEAAKRLERLLEEKIERTDYRDAGQMLEMQGLCLYAQSCGVVSAGAVERFKEKKRMLRKMVRRLD